MITESSTTREIREGIIADTKAFLTGLESGATDDQLRAVLQRIREQELHLIKAGGTMLDPKIWGILLNRLAQRDGQEIIDNTAPPRQFMDSRLHSDSNPVSDSNQAIDSNQVSNPVMDFQPDPDPLSTGSSARPDEVI